MRQPAQLLLECDLCLNAWRIPVDAENDKLVNVPEFSKCPECEYPTDLRFVQFDSDDDSDGIGGVLVDV